MYFNPKTDSELVCSNNEGVYLMPNSRGTKPLNTYHYGRKIDYLTDPYF
jgi:hypothetical protein